MDLILNLWYVDQVKLLVSKVGLIFNSKLYDLNQVQITFVSLLSWQDEPSTYSSALWIKLLGQKYP